MNEEHIPTETEQTQIRLDNLMKRYAALVAEVERRDTEQEEKPLTNSERIAELETKMAKLWYLLTDKPRGKNAQEKLSKFGLNFRNKFGSN